MYVLADSDQLSCIFCISSPSLFRTDTGCPATSDGEIPVGVSCIFDDQSCVNIDCPDGQLCCQLYSGCAPACVDPVIVCETPNDTEIQVGESYTRENSCTDW